MKVPLARCGRIAKLPVRDHSAGKSEKTVLTILSNSIFDLIDNAIIGN